jgi:Asp-tRNA(Asn)/Glu-tRNA(Gln) amidotransferase C subunit
MNGVAKVIDELGLMILAKDIELELKQEEINKLKRKIETIEQYIEMYDEHCNYEFKLNHT